MVKLKTTSLKARGSPRFASPALDSRRFLLKRTDSRTWPLPPATHTVARAQQGKCKFTYAFIHPATRVFSKPFRPPSALRFFRKEIYIYVYILGMYVGVHTYIRIGVRKFRKDTRARMLTSKLFIGCFYARFPCFDLIDESL